MKQVQKQFSMASLVQALAALIFGAAFYFLNVYKLSVAGVLSFNVSGQLWIRFYQSAYIPLIVAVCMLLVSVIPSRILKIITGVLGVVIAVTLLAGGDAFWRVVVDDISKNTQKYTQLIQTFLPAETLAQLQSFIDQANTASGTVFDTAKLIVTARAELGVIVMSLAALAYLVFCFVKQPAQSAGRGNPSGADDDIWD